MIKALLCDFDGTIVNTIPFYLQAYDMTLRFLGFEFPKEEVVKQCFGKTEEEICEALGVSEKTDDFKQKYFSEVKTFAVKTSVFPHAKELLQSLKDRNKKLAVVTFQYRWYIDLMLPAVGLQSFFDTVISYDDVPHAKPAPDAVLKACEVFGIQTSDALMIGDTKSDVRMGKSAGAKTALFLPDVHESIYNFDELRQTNPDFQVSTWQDMEQIV